MKSLNQDQIETITSDVMNAKLSLLALQTELIDHICCEVEGYMQEGLSFEDAYTKVSAECGIKRLKEIEEDTLLLTNKHYATMKTTMKISAITSLSLIAIGNLARILHLAGANIMMVLGFLILCILFIPSSMFLDYKNTIQKNTLKRILIIIGINGMVLGVLFKVMYWNGAGILLLTGWIIILATLLPTFINNNIKSEISKQQKNIQLLGILSLFLFGMATVFKLFHWPGAAVLFISGSILLIGIFMPLYSYFILKPNKGSLPSFIFLIIMAIYLVTITGLISIRPHIETKQVSYLHQSPNNK